jgi:hypothetical protein
VDLRDDGFIDLSRNVVAVEGHNGELIVDAHVRQGGAEDAANIYEEVSFTPASSGESHGMFDIGFCKMGVVVAWSPL